MTPIEQATIEYIEGTSQALGLALSELKRHEDGTKEASAVIDETVQLLLDNKLITDAEKPQAYASLSKHASTLQVLVNTVEFMRDRHEKDLRSMQAKAAALSQGRPAEDVAVVDLSTDPDAALIAASPSLRHKLQR